MKLTQEQIVKLIADAFRVGRAEGYEVGQKDGYASGLQDGHDEGYEEGYENGWDKGYEAAEQDAADAGEETGFESGSDKEDYECKCSQCDDHRHYTMGWNDGYIEAEIDPDMKENEAYMDGYLQGRDDRETKVELA